MTAITRRAWLGAVGARLIGGINSASARSPDRPFVSLFDGRTLAGWTAMGGPAGAWRVVDGAVAGPESGKSWLRFNQPVADFDLRLSYRIERGGNSGVLLRAPLGGDPSFEGLEVQILDDDARRYANLRPDQYTGSLYGLRATQRGATRPTSSWNRLNLRLIGPAVAVTLNGVPILTTDRLDTLKPLDGRKHPGQTRAGGFLGLQAHDSPVWFRDVALREV